MLFNTRDTKMLDCYDSYFDTERIGNSSACHVCKVNRLSHRNTTAQSFIALTTQ